MFSLLPSPTRPSAKTGRCKCSSARFATRSRQGKQWIGWTTGETQADRYDLSKQVDEIRYRKDGDDNYQITVIKDGDVVLTKPQQTAKDLEALIGKEVAQKIVSNEGKPTAPGALVHKLSGLDLKVGGEGMRGFYDQILPKEIGKYVKQWGVGVEKGSVQTQRPSPSQPSHDEFGVSVLHTPIWRVNITPEMAKGVAMGQPLFAKPREAIAEPEEPVYDQIGDEEQPPGKAPDYLKLVQDKGLAAAKAIRAKWDQRFDAWVKHQGDMGSFVEKPVEMTQPKWIATGTRESADVVSRNPREAERPWRVTHFMRYSGPEIPPEWFAADIWEPTGHTAHDTKEEAFMEAWKWGGKRYTTKSLFAKPREGAGTGDLFSLPSSRIDVGRSKKDAANGISRIVSLGKDEQLALAYAQPEGAALRKGGPAGVPAAPTPAGELSGQEVREALAFDKLAPLKRAFAAGEQISSIIPALVTREIPVFAVQGKTIKTAADFAMLAQSVRSPFFESLKIAVLDEDGKVLHSQIVFVGSLAQSIADFRDITAAVQRATGKLAGARVIVSHNHPSGDPRPSDADLRVQKTFETMSQTLGIKLLDHVITDGPLYYSMKDQREGRLEGAPLAPWEKIGRGELGPPVDAPEVMKDVVKLLRQVNPQSSHIVYLNTKMRIQAVERTGEQDLARVIGEGIAREGPYGVLIDFAPTLATTPSYPYQPTQLMPIFHNLLRPMNVPLIDASWQGVNSARSAGYVREGRTLLAKPRDTGTGDLFAQPVAAPEKAQALPTIETTGEGQLFPESELPFNLQGEIDTTPERQAAADAARAERERQAEAERAQRSLFAKPRATDTPEFKRWFSDSKVVDDSGKPLVVYSGHSNAELFGDRFDPRQSTAGGFYASEDPEIAR